MTRGIEQIEADLTAAREAWHAAVSERDAANGVLAGLRGRVVAGEGGVTAPQLGKAQDAATFADLGVPRLHAAMAPLEAELRAAQADAVVSEVAAALPPLADAVDAAYEGARTALAAYVTAWSNHAQAVRSAVDQLDLIEPLTERVRRVYGGLTLDGGERIKPRPVFDPIEALAGETAKLAARHGARTSQVIGRTS